jgi:hypothetical protein
MYSLQATQPSSGHSLSIDYRKLYVVHVCSLSKSLKDTRWRHDVSLSPLYRPKADPLSRTSLASWDPQFTPHRHSPLLYHLAVSSWSSVPSIQRYRTTFRLAHCLHYLTEGRAWYVFFFSERISFSRRVRKEKGQCYPTNLTSMKIRTRLIRQHQTALTCFVSSAKGKVTRANPTSAKGKV